MLTARGDGPSGGEPTGPGLIADIGGTNVRFALVQPDGTLAETALLKSDDFADPAAAAEHFLAEAAPAVRPRRAAFAIACPVIADRVAMTNHPWVFSVEALRRRLRLDRLTVLNDFVAVALAAPRLAAVDRRQLGGPAQGAAGAPLAIVGPGTGLGVAGLVPSGSGWIAVASEGGHVTLPATDEREAKLIAVLAARFGHVSAERALSGPGLVNLYEALCDLDGRTPEPDMAPDTVAARAGGCPVCAEALATFCALLGTVAGDACLTYGARGGLYIAGGIVPRLGETFAAAAFRHRFEAKGRFHDYLAAIPAYVITRDTPAFLGLTGLVADF